MRNMPVTVRTLLLMGGAIVLSLGWENSWSETLPDARALVQQGTVEVGAAGGYLQVLDILTFDSANRNAFYVLPRLGIVVADKVGSGYLTGNVEVLAEPLYAHYFQPFSASTAGGSLVAKYNLLSFGRWMPYWDVGAGMLWTNLAPRISEQSTPFNFVPESGPGSNILQRSASP